MQSLRRYAAVIRRSFMDWFLLWNSLRIALISTVLIFFLGILAAYYIARLPRVLKGILDVVLTLPLVLTVLPSRKPTMAQA